MDAGHGQTLLFIHGAGESHSVWADQTPFFRTRNRVVAVDLPGHGRSKPLQGEVTVPRYAESLAKAVMLAGLSPIISVGHSMGGAIALTLALDYSELVKALVLVNTGAKLGVLPEILEGLKTRYEETLRSIILPRCLSKGARRELVEETIHEALACSSEVVHQDYSACNRFDVRSRLKEIQVPTLIFAGEEDELTPTKWAHYLQHNIASSQLVVLKGAAHMVMKEKPYEFNAHLSAFLSSMEQGREP